MRAWLALVVLALAAQRTQAALCGEGTTYDVATDKCLADTCADPSITVHDNTLKIVGNSGTAIGYQVGNRDPVYFDEMETSENVVAAAYVAGQTAGQAICQQQERSDIQQLRTEVDASLQRLQLALDNASVVLGNAIDGTRERIDDETTDRLAAVTAALSTAKEMVDDEATARTNALALLAAEVAAQADRITLMEKSAGGAQQPPIYWLSVHYNALPLENGQVVVPPGVSVPVQVFGYGFQPFFHVNAPATINCSFDNLQTAGYMVQTDSFYHIECPTPTGVTAGSKKTLEISLSPTVPVPFQGPTDLQNVLFGTRWVSAEVVGRTVTVNGFGFNPSTQYTCQLGALAVAATFKAATQLECRYTWDQAIAAFGNVFFKTVAVSVKAGNNEIASLATSDSLQLPVQPDGSQSSPFETMAQVASVDPGSGFFFVQFDNAPVHETYLHKQGNKYWVLVASITDSLGHGQVTPGEGFWYGRWRSTITTGTARASRSADFKSSLYHMMQADDLLIMQGFSNSNDGSMDSSASEIAWADNLLSSRGRNLHGLMNNHVNLERHSPVSGTVIGGLQFLKGSAASSRDRYRRNSAFGELSPSNSIHFAPANCESYTFSLVNALGCHAVGCNVEHYTWVGDVVTNYAELNFPEPNWSSDWGINAGSWMYWQVFYSPN